VPDRVVCSTATRTRETWQLAAEALGAEPQTVFEDRVYEASITDVLDLARQTPAAVRTLLIVGHDPAMRGLTLELAGDPLDDAEAQALAQVRVKYPTAAIAVLSVAGEWPELGAGEARLSEFVVPDDFGAGHGKRG